MTFLGVSLYHPLTMKQFCYSPMYFDAFFVLFGSFHCDLKADFQLTIQLHTEHTETLIQTFDQNTCAVIHVFTIGCR